MKRLDFRGVTRTVLTALAAAGINAGAWAQAFPNKAVRVIVPFSPAGAADNVARALGQQLSERWHQPVVIDNRPGGNTLIGTQAAAKAAPDGYTLLLTADATLVMNPSLYPKLPYDPVKDFEPVSVLFSTPQILAVHKSVAATSVKELIALAKAKPGSLTYASTGNGSTTQLNTELLKSVAGIDVVHVPYKGGAPALNDLVGGQISMMIIAEGLALPYVKAGTLRALAVGTPKRSALLPSVPTFAEAGLPGYEAAPWFGLLAPAKTPRDIVAKVHADVTSALNDQAVRKRLAEWAIEPIGSTPQEFSKLIQTDTGKWARVIRQTGVQLE